MHQNMESDDNKLENYCMAWGVDDISFYQFEHISQNKCWNDYEKSIKLIKMICNTLKINDLMRYLSVSPSFNNDSPGILTYSIYYDNGHSLYLSIDISHEINSGTYGIYITEYDARLCESKERPAYHYSNIFGPFTEDMPLNNQELYEKTRLWHTRISKHIKVETHANN